MRRSSGFSMIVGIASTLWLAGCAGPPPLPPDQVPAPPPVYGLDPYQTQSAGASGGGVGIVVPDTGTPAVAMTKEQAMAHITQSIEERSAQLAKGFEEEGEISSDKVSMGDEKRFAVTGMKGRCLRMLAVADTGIPKLDMYLYNGETLLDRDIGDDNYPVVSACFKKDIEVTLAVKVDSGAGWFMVKVFSKKNDGTVKTTMEAVEQSGK
jgi:hypothetical protein